MPADLPWESQLPTIFVALSKEVRVLQITASKIMIECFFLSLCPRGLIVLRRHMDNALAGKNKHELITVLFCWDIKMSVL